MKQKPSRDPSVAIGYIRVSTEDQNLGPLAQREAMEAWCAARKITLVAVFEDRVCGAVELDKRPALLNAIDSLPHFNAGIFLVAKRDRLARDVIASAMIERLVQRHAAAIVSTAGEGTEDEGPSGVLQRGIIDLFAQYERALIRARTKAALGVIRNSGRKTGGQCPSGYVDIGEGHIEPVKPMLDLVRGAVEDGVGVRILARRLNAKKHLTSMGKPFSPTQAERLVENYRSRGLLPIQ